MSKYTDDDYCDIYEKKICDNCGKCLENDGIDIQAIKIEDISKSVEENKILEDEYKKELLNLSGDVSDTLEDNEDYNNLQEAYNTLEIDNDTNAEDSNPTYEDAFDHIEYIDDLNLFDDTVLEEMTEEIFPGVRKIKK